MAIYKLHQSISTFIRVVFGMRGAHTNAHDNN